MVHSKTAFVVYGVHKDGLKDPDGTLFIDYDLIYDISSLFEKEIKAEKGEN